MKIRINERIVALPEDITVVEVRERFKPDADVVVLNGFPFTGGGALAEGDELFLIKRGEQPSAQELEYVMTARHTPKIHKKLKQAAVGIAGVGGLGSNVAVALARVGVGKLIIADFDVVEPSNLNRQQYFVDQMGMYKTDAMKSNLLRVNPYVDVITHRTMLTPDNIPEIFSSCMIIIEAFDRVEMKTMLINTVMEKMPDVKVIAASGLAGYGPNNDIKTMSLSKRLYVVGDLVSEAKPGMGLMAPRVGIAASQQANQAVRIILGEEDE